MPVRLPCALLVLCGIHLFASATGAQVVLVSSDFNDSVPMFSLTGEPLGHFVPPGGGGLDSPQGITVGPDGNVYVSSAVNDKVLKYNGTTGAFMGEFVSGGQLDQPWFLTFGPDGDLYVSSSLTNRVLCYDGVTGAFKRTAAAGGGLTRPDGISFAPDGTMLVSQFAPSDSRIKRYQPLTGGFLGDVVDEPGLAGALENRLSADGATLFVSSFQTSEIRTYRVSDGQFLGNFISGAPLNGPVGQLLLPDGSLLVSSWLNSSLLRYDGATGAFLNTFASAGLLDHPNNMALLASIPEPGVAGAGLLAWIGLLRVCTRRPPP